MDAKPDENAAPCVINGRINGRYAKGFSGNPGGSPEATRRAFNKDFLVALARDFKAHGEQVLARVRRESPATYLKVCAMLVPREMRVEHNHGVKAMSDEELEQGIEMITAMLAAREAGAKVIEPVSAPEQVALPAPSRKPRRNLPVPPSTKPDRGRSKGVSASSRPGLPRSPHGSSASSDH